MKRRLAIVAGGVGTLASPCHKLVHPLRTETALDDSGRAPATWAARCEGAVAARTAGMAQAA